MDSMADRSSKPELAESGGDGGLLQAPAKPASVFSNLDSIRLSGTYAQSVGVKKLRLTVPIRKPGRQDFIRVHPDPAYRVETHVLELKDERETYFVVPQLWPEMPAELTAKALFTTINRQKVVSLWPVRLPGEDGKLDEWNQSALEAADHAMGNWVRVAANMSLGAYEVFQASADLPDPEWPDESFQHLLEIAFKGRIIDGLDHPVVKGLRGEL